MPARSVIDLDARDEFDSILADLLGDPKIIELQLTDRQINVVSGTARMLLLPMQNDSGKICRVLGCISFLGAKTSPPRRFLISNQKTTRIVSTQKVTPEQIVTGFAEKQDSFKPPPSRPERVEKPSLQSLDGGCSLDRARMRKTRPKLWLVKDD